MFNLVAGPLHATVGHVSPVDAWPDQKSRQPSHGRELLHHQMLSLTN
jgi:hypothetical protein